MNKIILILIITLISFKSYAINLSSKIPLMFIEILQGKRDVSLVHFISSIVLLFLVVFLFVKILDMFGKKK